MISFYVGDYVRAETSLLDLVRKGDIGIIVELETHPELLIIHWKSGSLMSAHRTHPPGQQTLPIRVCARR